MEPRSLRRSKASVRFVDLWCSHRSLSSYEDEWNLMFHHNYSLADLMEMTPWQYEVHLSFTSGYLEQQAMKAKQDQLNAAR